MSKSRLKYKGEAPAMKLDRRVKCCVSCTRVDMATKHCHYKGREVKLTDTCECYDRAVGEEIMRRMVESGVEKRVNKAASMAYMMFSVGFNYLEDVDIALASLNIKLKDQDEIFTNAERAFERIHEHFRVFFDKESSIYFTDHFAGLVDLLNKWSDGDSLVSVSRAMDEDTMKKIYRQWMAETPKPISCEQSFLAGMDVVMNGWKEGKK